jgi:hypothetical protein
VNRTKVLVYTFNGFCSALAGIAYAIYVGSGHGTHASNGFEMIVIAAVVIGGTMLTGGEGYVFGSLFGVLVVALIQTLIQFNGKLLSWWASIAIGSLTLVFIGVQSLVANLNIRQLTGTKLISKAKESTQAAPSARSRNRQRLLFGGGALLVIVLAVLAFAVVRNTTHGPVASALTPTPSGCQLKPFRQDQAADLMKAGAVIVYERNGGLKCVDELYAIYPDGRITGDNGTQNIEKQVTPADVDKLLSDINNLEWFTDNMYSTSHTPCGACFTYFTSVLYNGQEKTVQAVDGGTDVPPNYWQMSGMLSQVLPTFAPAP